MSEQEENGTKSGWILYPIGSKPKWPLAALLGLQQYLTMFGATVLIPFIIGGAIGMPPDKLALLISTMFFASGICTLIQQSPLGNRLPIIQGGTFSFLGPAFAIIGMVAGKKLTGVDVWQIQLQELAAAVMIASLVEIILGYTGILGKIKNIISPIVIGPTIAMIGLALYSIGAPWMAANWYISMITIIALIVYSQVFSIKSKVFMMFPVLLAIITGWLAALFGTVTGMISPDSAAYLKTDLIASASWFSFAPMMPFKWGFPDFSSATLWAGAVAMLAGYLASMVESIGDYYACARISEAPVPTERMISRGLGAEGLGCLVAGILQTGNGTTSYSENIGSIGLTRVASRRVIIAGAILMLIVPICGKFGASLATIPKPVVGAMFVGLFGMIASVGLSNLQLVNLNNSRNLFIVGLAFFCGLSVPYHFNPMLSAAAVPIAWGAAGSFVNTLGNICQALLTTGMFVTAIVAIILDNFLPGATKAERGLEAWEKDATEEAWIAAEKEWDSMEEGQARVV
ncbi:uracil-xanthine permease family protein [Desulfobacula sp.]|jgi:uracil-xanthine permease|uniref:uracil-xanthine permease family protein n=3 Tax=Desulfobacula sp. TaxID=2593537 RepID=UPI0039B83111|nr:purine/pyrimidine permease [Desulfobacula sp.]MBT5970538.1 purine/pyrimidine permease [Desulfobacula sp.]